MNDDMLWKIKELEESLECGKPQHQTVLIMLSLFKMMVDRMANLQEWMDDMDTRYGKIIVPDPCKKCGYREPEK